jgi:hypothetical protein
MKIGKKKRKRLELEEEIKSRGPRIGPVEFGLVHDREGRIKFSDFAIDHCFSGCIIFTVSCFGLTILRGDCLEHAKELKRKAKYLGLS